MVLGDPNDRFGSGRRSIPCTERGSFRYLRHVPKHSRPIVLIGVAALMIACSPPSGTTPAIESGHIRIPSMPLQTSSVIRVDGPTVEEFQCTECEDADFFYGALPAATFDALVPAPSAQRRSKLLGNLLVSGYFGGIYLRGAISPVGAVELSRPPLFEDIGRTTLAGLADQVASILEIVDHGDDQAVVDASKIWSNQLALVLGYNRGYLDVALANSPPGAIPGSTVTCVDLLECRGTTFPLQLLDELAAAKASVPSEITTLLSNSIETGRIVWTAILNGNSFTAGSYATIIDLSGGFLQATQAALWASAATTATPSLRREGLTLVAALLVWAGSYFIGLASPLPNTAQPSLNT